MNTKVIFFDIDGTLINYGGEFPESAQRALRQAKENGHQIILCTGRSRCQIEKRLLDFGFDGFVCAAGAYVEHHYRVINQEQLGEKRLESLLNYMDANNMVYMIQCPDKIVSTTACIESIKEYFIEHMGNKLPTNISKVFESQVIDDDLLKNIGRYDKAEKLCYYRSTKTVDEVSKDIGEDFDVIDMSFDDIKNDSGEISRAGITKAYGMERLIDYLNVSRENTVAFGDGSNDFEMIDFAGIGVAMGNATEDLKIRADVITSKVVDDGIYNGMKKLKLI